MTNKKKKAFDAVEMMRKIRNQLTNKYLKDPGKEQSDLEKVRIKYNILSGKKKRA